MKIAKSAPTSKLLERCDVRVVEPQRLYSRLYLAITLALGRRHRPVADLARLDRRFLAFLRERYCVSD
jgi:hypothetical protein